MKIAYLCASSLIDRSEPPHRAAAEHKTTIDALTKALAEAPVPGELVQVAWDDVTFDFADVDAALVGSSWDYTARHTEFLESIDRIDSQTKLFNTPDVIHWNTNKRYLIEVAGHDISSINTCWLNEPSEAAIRSAFDALSVDEVVVKRQIGAGAEGQYRLKRGATILPPDPNIPLMVQPFVPKVETEGEYSFIFIDGTFCHAVQKKPKRGDYRVQGIHGGEEERITPEKSDLIAASKVMAILREPPLYARVDMVRGPEAKLYLMEFELVEPYLFPDHCDSVMQKMVAALTKRLSA